MIQLDRGAHIRAKKISENRVGAYIRVALRNYGNMQDGSYLSLEHQLDLYSIQNKVLYVGIMCTRVYGALPWVNNCPLNESMG